MSPLWAPVSDPPGAEVLRLVLMLVITGEGGPAWTCRGRDGPTWRAGGALLGECPESPRTAMLPGPELREGRE